MENYILLYSYTANHNLVSHCYKKFTDRFCGGRSLLQLSLKDVCGTIGFCNRCPETAVLVCPLRCSPQMSSLTDVLWHMVSLADVLSEGCP